MKHTKVPYEVAERAVSDYKAWVEGASERLVDAYTGYLVNYLQLLHKGDMDLNDKSLRTFISLFVKDRDKKARIHQWKYSKTARTEIMRIKAMIQEQFKSFGRDELWNELVTILLEMASRYQKREQRSGFHNYMWQAFPYYTYRRLMKLITDPVVFRPDLMAVYSEGTFQDSESGLEPVLPDEQEWHMAIDDSLEDLNENWLNGLTCSPAFALLNPFERRVLVLYHVNGLEDGQIADELGCCRATVNRRRLHAEQEIFQAMKSQGVFRSDQEYIEAVKSKARGEGAKADPQREKAEERAEAAAKRATRNLKRWHGRAE